MIGVLRFFCYVVLSVVLATPIVSGRQFLKMAGGPAGGSFQDFAKGIAEYYNRKNQKCRIDVFASNGSVQNLIRVNSGRVDLGIMYAGEAYLSHSGKLARKVWKKRNHVRALAFLYASPAQLVVLQSSAIKSIFDLKGKVLDVGGPGSGAESAAQRFFRTVKIWDKLQVSNRGYSAAASDMAGEQIDAMWVLSGFPTPAISELSQKKKIRLLDLSPVAESWGLFKEHPYYQKITIPGGTYPGVVIDTDTYFDTTLLVANVNLEDDLVEKLLEGLFSEEGLAFLRSKKEMARQTTVKNGLTGIVIPLHKAAQRFWLKKGQVIPKRAMAE